MDQGIPVFQGPERAARTIRAIVEYTLMRERILSGAANPRQKKGLDMVSDF